MRILTIKKSAEFQKIGKRNSKFYSKTVLLLSSPTSPFYSQDTTQGKNAKDFCRVGYTVSKVVGNAVKRNLAKRRLREAVRVLVPEYAKLQSDYVIIARREISSVEYGKIFADLKFCLKRIHKNNSSHVSKKKLDSSKSAIPQIDSKKS